MPHSKLLYHNSKPEVKTKTKVNDMMNGSTDSGCTMLETSAMLENSAMMANSIVADNFPRMENVPRVQHDRRMYSTTPHDFLRGRNPRFSGHVRSRSAPEGHLRTGLGGARSSRHFLNPVNTNGQEENMDVSASTRAKTRYASQKSTTHLMNHSAHWQTESATKDRRDENEADSDFVDLFELFNSSTQVTSSSQRLFVNTSGRRQEAHPESDLVPDCNVDPGTDEVDSLLEDFSDSGGVRVGTGGVSIPFGGRSSPREERGYDSSSSNLSSPAGEESGIDRVVKSLLRISDEIESDDGFRQDFGALAMEVTNSLEDESFLNDFPSFSHTMDNILDHYYDQASFSSATPFKKMLFIVLVNMLFIRRLRQRTSRFLSTMVDYATQYIASFLPAAAMIRRSSSVMSDLCNAGRARGEGRGEASSSSGGSASRSRLSSVGATSTCGVEESLFNTSRGGNRNSMYSSTFDLDLSSMSTGSGAPYGNESNHGPQGPVSFSFGATGGGFETQGIQVPTTISNQSQRGEDNSPLHAILSPPPLSPFNSNYGATPFASPNQQQVPMTTPTSSSMIATDGNGNASTSSSRYGDIDGGVLSNAKNIPGGIMGRGRGRVVTSLSEEEAHKADEDRKQEEGRERKVNRSFQSGAVLSKFFNTAKSKEDKELSDPPRDNASRLATSQSVVRKKDPKVTTNKKRLTESASYDFAPVRRKESDVDSAFCTEEESFAFPSFDSSVDHEHGLLMESLFTNTPGELTEPNSRFRDNLQNQENSSHTRPLFLAQTREEYRQAAIRRRRMFGVQGRLPSFSDEMTAAFTGVQNGSLASAGDYFAPRSAPNDGAFASGAHSRANRNATGSSTGTDPGVKSVYVTVTFFILAAMIQYRHS